MAQRNPPGSQSEARPRVPPRQEVIDRFPVLTYGERPEIDLATWRLEVGGLVEAPLDLSWEEFQGLPKTAVVSDFHCVTLWSRLDDRWEGTLMRDLLALARPRPEARHVLLHSYGGYTTNLELATLLEPEVILATAHDGRELTPEHGWPLRLVVPSRYAWKSAKWVHRLELVAEEVPGFWEQRGFHSNADPWQEQRFWDGLPMDLGLTLALCSDKL